MVSDKTAGEYVKVDAFEKLRNSLKYDQFEVEVAQKVSKGARGSITRTLSIH